MTKTTADDILTALRANVEGGVTRTDQDGAEWWSVYLDNARPTGISAHAFAGFLSALDRRGLYRSYDDGCFGEVKMPDRETA